MQQKTSVIAGLVQRSVLRAAQLLSGVLMAMVLTSVPAWAGGSPVVVDETSVDWGFLIESGAPTSGFAMGPGVPPVGSGSAGFQLTGGSDGVILATLNHAGTRLADLIALTYSTYQNVTPQAVALQLNIDYDASDSAVSWQGRLVYEPYYTQAISTLTWQSWNTLADPSAPTGSGNWWSTGTPIVGDTSIAAACTISSPCTMSEILLLYPDAAISNGVAGVLLLKAGSGWPAGAELQVDALRVATAATDVTYDFETVVPVELMTFTIE